MADWFEITDEQLSGLKDKVVVLTGCSSGIGLATTNLLLSLGAKVVGGDLNPPPIKHANLTFQSTDVTSWTSLSSLFKHAHSTYGGRIDHVFANAGIASTTNFLDLKEDSSGELIEPPNKTFDVNLRGVTNTSALAFHYMRNQTPAGGSVVATSSASAFQRFCVVDYASAKHGVLGFVRGMIPTLKTAGLPIRINAIAPSWTRTGLVPDGVPEEAGKASQSPEAVARSVAILMADENRNGQLIYSEVGKFKEIDEAVLLKANKEILGDGLDDNTVMERMHEIIQRRKQNQTKPS